MRKAKINFEIEQEDLANAKAYIARHGGSLNRLVSAFLASLGSEECLNAPATDQSRRILLEVSTGKFSLVNAAVVLGLVDAGYVLHRLREERLPLPRLSEIDVRRQSESSIDAFKECLLTPGEGRKMNKRKKSAIAAEREGC